MILWPLLVSGVLAAPVRQTGSTLWDEIMARQATWHAQEGVLRMRGGDYPAAVRFLSKAVVSNPQDPDLRVLFGVAQYWAGEVDQAMASYREAIRMDFHNDNAYSLLGIAHAWKGELGKALEMFLKAVELAPQRADIQMDLGSVYEALGWKSRALDYFRRAVQLSPQEPLYHYQLGVLYVRLGREGEAIESLEKAAQIFPSFQDAILELAAVRQRRGELAQALALFQKAVRLKPLDAVARLRLGLAYLENEEPHKARAVFRPAFRLTPLGEGGRLALSVAYAGQTPSKGRGESRSSEEMPEKSGPLGPLRKNLEQIPPDREAMVTVEVAYHPKEQAPASASGGELKRALEKRLASAPVMGLRRQVHLPADQPEFRARQVRALLSELEALFEKAQEGSDLRLGLEVSYPEASRAGAPAPGEKSQKKVGFEPRRVGNDLGLWVLGTGWSALVEEAMDRIGHLPGQGPERWTALGLAHIALGETSEALEIFGRALQESPLSVDAHLGMAVAWVESGEERRAVRLYQKVLQEDPKNEIAQEALKWLAPDFPAE
ncbi:MAG: tetratricopeptide repeat protein [Elusimicrobia bacterium]|nr:tetratricopeptide repeat protein [Elusimicrobiota bacterium]